MISRLWLLSLSVLFVAALLSNFITDVSSFNLRPTKSQHKPQLQQTIDSGTMSAAAKKVMKLQHPASCSGKYIMSDITNLYYIGMRSFYCVCQKLLGMFWRGDPTTKSQPPSSDNWPRNGALLEGTGPIVVDGESYFKVSAIQQAGKKGFISVPEGTYMLYNQGGPVLHDVE